MTHLKCNDCNTILQQDDVKSETKSQSPLAIGTIKMKSEHSQESMHSFGASHLSEDSNSGDASPINSFAGTSLLLQLTCKI